MNDLKLNIQSRRRLVKSAGLLLAVTMGLAACGASSGEVAAGGDDSVSDPPSGDTTTVPDNDSPIGGGPYPVATLSITITHPEHEDVAYIITCLGDTATVSPELDTSADGACLALADTEVERLLVQGQPEDQICTEIYGGADVALIVGEINGQQVNLQIDRTNGCGIADWESLGAALPPSWGA